MASMKTTHTGRTLTWLRICLPAIVAGSLLMGASCQRTVMRNGVRVPVGEAQKLDLDQGARAMEEERYDDALAVYNRFLEDFPNSRNTALVMVRIGECHYRKGECGKARLAFEDVIDRYPAEPEAADAAWGLALCAYQDEDCNRVMEVLGAYRDLADGRRWDQMTMLNAKCALESNLIDKAFQLYGEEHRQGSDPEFKSVADKNAELLARRMEDSELEELAYANEGRYPGDLALLELIRRAVKDEDFERAEALVKMMKREHPRTVFRSELDDYESLVEKWSKVRFNRIGLLLPLSGMLGEFGQSSLKGAVLAAGIFEGMEPVLIADLIIRDTSGQEGRIGELVEELVDDEYVIGIVGPMRTGLAEQAAIRAQELGVPLVTLSPGENLPDMGDMVYQNCLTKSDQVEALAEYAVTGRDMRTFAVLYPGDDYGREFYNLFMTAVTDRDGEIKAALPYPLDATDFHDPIKELKDIKEQKNFEGLFIPDSWSRVAMIAPQIRFYELTEVTLLGTNSWHDPALWRSVQPEDLEGSVFPDGIAPDSDRLSYLSFYRRFRKEYDAEPGLVEAQAFETVDLLLYLIRTYRVRDRKQLKAALDHVVDHPGALGDITVLPNGKWHKRVYVFCVSEGETRLVSESE